MRNTNSLTNSRHHHLRMNATFYLPTIKTSYTPCNGLIRMKCFPSLQTRKVLIMKSTRRKRKMRIFFLTLQSLIKKHYQIAFRSIGRERKRKRQNRNISAPYPLSKSLMKFLSRQSKMPVHLASSPSKIAGSGLYEILTSFAASSHARSETPAIATTGSPT